MKVLDQFRTGIQVKAAGVNALPFPSASSWMFTPPSRIDTRKAGDGTGNSAAVAVIRSMGRAFSEPTVREYVRVDGQDQIVEDSPTAQLVAEPNPYMESDLIWLYTVASIAGAGNAYLHKVRDLMGNVIQLWPLYPNLMKPHTSQTGTEFIDHWTYQVPGKQPVNLPPADVVQLRWQMDPTDHRLGQPLLKEALLEVMTDDEASLFTAALLANLGVPGVILTPKDPDDPGPQGDAKTKMIVDYQQSFGGANRGKPMIIGGGSMDVNVVSFSPKEMDLKALRQIPEERISAVLGWPAILSGLGAGLTATSGKGEANTIREHATESTLVPLWRLTGAQLTRQLLRDVKPSGWLGFDTSDVRALAKDENDTVKRMDTAVRGGWALVSEGRRTIGLPVEDQHEVFLRNINTMAVGVTDDPMVGDIEGEPEG